MGPPLQGMLERANLSEKIPKILPAGSLGGGQTGPPLHGIVEKGGNSQESSLAVVESLCQEESIFEKIFRWGSAFQETQPRAPPSTALPAFSITRRL